MRWPRAPETGTLHARNARARPAGSPSAFGAGPSRGNVGSRRKWGSCPAAWPRRGLGLRPLSSARARPTQSPTPPRIRRPRARPPGAAGEHSRGGPASVRCDLGSRPSWPQAQGSGPRLPCRGGTRHRPRSERVPRSLLPAGGAALLPLGASVSSSVKWGRPWPRPRAGLRLRRAVSATASSPYSPTPAPEAVSLDPKDL